MGGFFFGLFQFVYCFSVLVRAYYETAGTDFFGELRCLYEVLGDLNEELFSAFFDQVALGVFLHIIEKLDDTGLDEKIDDRLALRFLLAPDKRGDQVGIREFGKAG